MIQKLTLRERSKWMILNGFLYALFMILSVAFLITEDENVLAGLLSIMMLFIMYGAVSLLKHGIKLSKRV